MYKRQNFNRSNLGVLLGSCLALQLTSAPRLRIARRLAWVLLGSCWGLAGILQRIPLYAYAGKQRRPLRRGSHSTKTKPHRITCGVLRNKSLTMTYFHRRPSTIIGAKAFHCPVRDGKEWYHLAMVVRRNWLSCCVERNRSNLGRNTTCGDQRLAR